MRENFIAHVRQIDEECWAIPHLLSDHLFSTSEKAEILSAKFKSGSWGKAAGFAHDVGKGRLEWQAYLNNKSGYGYDDEAHLESKFGKMPHAIHGAALAESIFGKAVGRLLAYCIAGHHAGLPDWSNALGAGRAAMQVQLAGFEDKKDIDPDIVRQLEKIKPGRLPWQFENGLDAAMWVRMLYSCLVDADLIVTLPSWSNLQGLIRSTK